MHKLEFCLDSPLAKLPSRGSAFAAGLDLSASAPATVPAGGRAMIATGLRVAIPPGFYGRVASRSGLARDRGIAVGAGVIDADYRGPIGVLLFNHSDEDFAVSTGARIAQLIIERALVGDEISVVSVDALSRTEREANGFGSTGSEPLTSPRV